MKMNIQQSEEIQIFAKRRKRVRKKRKIGQDIVFLATEILLILFLILYTRALFDRNTSRDVSIDTISQKMENHGVTDGLVSGDANTLKQRFSLNTDMYSEAIVYTSESMMDVSELLIVKTENTTQLEELEDAIEQHLEEQKKKFDGYGTNQSSLLEHAVMIEKGDYFFYGVSDQIEQWEGVFLSCI